MIGYYVNNHAQDNGDHEVHTKTCSFLPGDKKYLGEFSNCADAVREAKKYHSKSNGCYFCCNACHTT